MQNARNPGTVRKKHVCNICHPPLKNFVENTLNQPSEKRLTRPRVTPMIGESQNRVAAGLFIPIFLFFRSTCVRPQRRPDIALALRQSRKPGRTNCVSVATMRTTPMTMSAMTLTRRQENTSNRSKNANNNTKMSDEDLTIAVKTKM